MTTADLAPNRIVRGAIFPEPVQVLVVVSVGDSLKLIGKGVNSGRVYEPILNAQQIAALESSSDACPFDGDPQRFRLGIEAMRLGLAFEYDRILRFRLRASIRFLTSSRLFTTTF